MKILKDKNNPERKISGIATKKPVEIDWFEWHNSRYLELASWLKHFSQDVEEHFNYEAGKLTVNTLEGSSYDVPDGYIIIRGVQGEFYPCEPNIFMATYNIK